MSVKEITGLLTILPDKEKPDQAIKEDLQAGNIAFRSVTLRRTLAFWNNNNSGDSLLISTIPFKQGSLLDDLDINVGHAGWFIANLVNYPSSPTGSNVAMSTLDYTKFRATGTVGTVPAANLPRVHAGLVAYDNLSSATEAAWGGNSIVSSSDIPVDYTQIGLVYPHPAYQANTFSAAATLTTAVGTNFVTFTGGGWWDQVWHTPGNWQVLRIASGADAGYYFIHNVDFANNRLYLRNLNGTAFVGQAAATIAATELYMGPGRRAYFNEVSIIQFSTGVVETGGRFRPDPVTVRSSFIVKVNIDKTGSTEVAAGAEQQGSYYIGIKPWSHGDYDHHRFHDWALNRNYPGVGVTLLAHNFVFNPVSGGANGAVLDEVGQRYWAGYTDTSNNSGILHWRWRTIESPREVANYLGTGAHASFLTPTPVLATGDRIRGATLGSNRWVYFAVGHPTLGNGGLIIIKPDLTTLQYTEATGIPDSNLAGAVADKTRARLGTAGDVVTTVATDGLVSASGAFTDSDLGRAIKVTGATADNGTYKIATRISGTSITVQTLAGGAVSFAGGTGGTFEIGDRLYMFYNNGTTGAGKINYMESLAPGTFLTRTVTMTNGANCNIQGVNGETQKISIDPSNGDMYWVSNDTQQQINKYEVSTNTHTFRTIANVQSPAGGSPATPGTITLFTAIHVNSKFDEIWVGTDQGHVKLVKSDFAGANYKRYFGTESTTYVNPTGFQRPDGSVSATSGNSRFVRNYWEQPDGRIGTNLHAGATTNHDYAYYSRESDTFVWRNEIISGSSTTSGRISVFDSVGWGLDFCPGSAAFGTKMWLGSVEVNYQWIGSAWVPKEIGLAGLPNKSISDTTNPNCAAKPIHSGLEDLLYGAKIKFTRQGGATPANNEFLGRGGQTRTTATDGATTSTLDTFDGSGFVSGDTGRTLRIESGADAGIYKMTFVNAGQVTLKTLSGATFSAAATAGTLTYTVWDFGSPGSTAGPEQMTFILADGVSKDNTQDITGFTYEGYHFKTRLHENDEDRKCMVENPLAIPGSIATKMYYESYARATPQYDASTSHHKALPASEHANGRQLLDGVIGKLLNGTGAAGTVYSSPGNSAIWYGTDANTGVLGYSLMVDFGVDVQVGYAILRCRPVAGSSQGSLLLSTVSANGLRGNLYKANSAGGTPVASWISNGTGDTIGGAAPTMTLTDAGAAFTAADVGRYITIIGATTGANNGTFPVVTFTSSTLISYTNASGVAEAFTGTWYITTSTTRTSGTANLSITANTTTATATSGDFLGPITLTPTTPAVGQTTTGLTTFVDTTNAQFLTTHVGQVLKITAGAGADIGSYRITGYTSASVITIRNLDQTAKTWTVSSSTVTYEIRNGVREEDMLVSGVHRLGVERLLTTTTLQVRTGPNATVTTQNWTCVAPTWTHVKRISYSSEAVPPEVKNNGTWVSLDGREAIDPLDVKVYADFSDLSSTAKTGRWWKWTAIPRFVTNSVDTSHYMSTWEFYDTTGARLNTSSYTMVDESRTNADYFFNHVNRFDVIQSANDAMAGISGFNGNVDLTGAGGDTLTLTTGGNKFLGFQIGPALADGGLPIGTNQINSASSSWPASSMVGRMIRITSGANAGNFYRVTSRPSSTQVTVTTPSGTAVSWGGTESSIAFSVHEGFNVGGTAPDKLTFLEDGKEFTLATINDALTTLTFSETLQPLRTNKTWEIRRPGYDTTSATTEATKAARLTRPATTYPLQTGDLCHDSRGTYRFFSEDIGTGFQRADGVLAGGNGILTGSGFVPDDVGRLLYVTTGVNLGIYEISVYTSGTSITVKNHYTGAAISFTADAGPVTYQIYGDRRFRLTRFVVGLRA